MLGCALGVRIVIFYLSLFIASFIPSFQSNHTTSEWVRNFNNYLNKYPISRYLLKYLIAFIEGIVIGSPVLNKIYASLMALWPKVEIQIGPEHKKIEKRRRSILANTFAVGIAPILISIIYDILKDLVLK